MDNAKSLLIRRQGLGLSDLRITKDNSYFEDTVYLDMEKRRIETAKQRLKALLDTKSESTQKQAAELAKRLAIAQAQHTRLAELHGVEEDLPKTDWKKLFKMRQEAIKQLSSKPDPTWKWTYSQVRFFIESLFGEQFIVDDGRTDGGNGAQYNVQIDQKGERFVWGKKHCYVFSVCFCVVACFDTQFLFFEFLGWDHI